MTFHEFSGIVAIVIWAGFIVTTWFCAISTYAKTRAILERLDEIEANLVIHIKEKQYQDPYDTPEYAAFVQSMAPLCSCTPISDRPCAGLLAGGPCDDLHTERGLDNLDDDRDQDTEPEDL